jgi:hypothetical protein
VTPPGAATGAAAPAGDAQAQGLDQELERLAKEINKHLRQLTDLTLKSATLARDIGKGLLRVKEIVRGQKDSWMQWTKDHCHLSLRQAQKYMQLARRWDELVKAGYDPAGFTIDQNLALCDHPAGSLPNIDSSSSNKPPATKEADPSFQVASEPLLTEKQLQAYKLEEQMTFAADTPEGKYLQETTGSLVRQVRRQARRLAKAAATNRPPLDPAVLAFALVNQLRKLLGAAAVVEVVPPAATVTEPPPAEVVPPPTNRLNGQYVPALAS